MIEERPDRPSPYKARVRTPDGKYVSRSFKRRADAQAWVDSQRTDMRRGEWVDPKAGDVTLSVWLRQVTARKVKVSQSTLDTRDSLIRHHIDGSLGVYPIGNLTPQAIQQWIQGLIGKGLSPATIHKTHVIVAEALNLAVGWGRLVRNPNFMVELPQQHTPDHRYLTEPDVWALWDAMSDRYKPFVLLGAYGGLRPGEAFTSEWRDVQGRTLAIRGTKTKGSRRSISIPQALADDLARHRQAFPHIRYVLHNQAGGTVDGDHFRNRQWRRAVERSVGEPMRPYDLRHTHVALLIAKGAHSKVIADRLGHTSIRTTMDTYGHLLEGVEADVVDRLGGQRQDALR